MLKRALFVMMAIALLVSACGGGETDTATTVGADGVELFGGASLTSVTGTRAMTLGDTRVNVTMEDEWKVALSEAFDPFGSAFYVLQPITASGDNPALQFLRPSDLVEVADLGHDLQTRPEGGTIDLSSAFDLESWLSMLPADVEVAPREPVQFAGLDSVMFDIEMSESVCESACSFLIVEREDSRSGRFSLAGLATGRTYSVIWTDRGADAFPIVTLISGDDAFFEAALDVVGSAAIGEPPAE